MTQRPEGYAGFVDDHVFDALERLEGLSAEYGISMAGLALSWLLADPRIAAIVVGPMRPEHLDPVREALTRPLDPALRDEIGGMFG